MTSIRHDLDLISQVDGWGTLTWHDESSSGGHLRPASSRGLLAVGRRWFDRLATLAMGWRERARQRRALCHLDEHMRRDIGLDRISVQVELREPFLWR